MKQEGFNYAQGYEHELLHVQEDGEKIQPKQREKSVLFSISLVVISIGTVIGGIFILLFIYGLMNDLNTDPGENTRFFIGLGFVLFFLFIGLANFFYFRRRV